MGAFIGILIANVFYTFGPLHWYYFSSRSSVAVPMFASIFAIGLFWRSVQEIRQSLDCGGHPRHR